MSLPEGYGLVANRLSREREGLTVEQVLKRNSDILRHQMLARIFPNAVEGEDYEVIEQIISRLESHKSGGALHRIFELVRSGRVRWIMAIDLSRVTGDDWALAELKRLCKQMRVRLYLHNRMERPYDLNNPEDEMMLEPQGQAARYETLFLRMRIQNAKVRHLPLDVNTGVWRNGDDRGMGRHPNGQVPFGYIWRKVTYDEFGKKIDAHVEPDRRAPCPDYIPPGETTPPAYTRFQVAQMALSLFFSYGQTRVKVLLRERTGLHVSEQVLKKLARNPFVAGRPTSRLQKIENRYYKRDNPVATEGNYPPLMPWAEFVRLQGILDRRYESGEKTGSGAWASGLLECACGARFIGDSRYYACREHLHRISNRYMRGIDANPTKTYRQVEGWEQTPTCGRIPKERVHAYVEQELLKLVSDPDFAPRVAAYQRAQSESNPDRLAMQAEQKRLEGSLAELAEERQQLVRYAAKGVLEEDDIREQMGVIKRAAAAAEARLSRLKDFFASPQTPPGAFFILERLHELSFPEVWSELDDAGRSLVAHALIHVIKVSGTHRNKRLGETVPTAGFQEETGPGSAGDLGALASSSVTNDTASTFWKEEPLSLVA